ncbi:MAG: tetratricopeptide repeat protein [Acidithiobacillus sp.]
MIKLMPIRTAFLPVHSLFYLIILVITVWPGCVLADTDTTHIHGLPYQPWNPDKLTNAQALFLEGEALKGESIRKAMEKGAADGNTKAINALAIYYDQTKDYQKAIHWYKKGAEDGDPEAEYELGYFLCEGPGVTHDIQAGMAWLKKAADQKNQNAMKLMGYLYAEGKDDALPKDYNKAVSEYERAANAGSVFAAQQLATAYEDGLYGLPKDQQFSQKWGRVAKKNGSESVSQTLSNNKKNIAAQEEFNYYEKHGNVPKLTPTHTEKTLYVFYKVIEYGFLILVLVGVYFQRKLTKQYPKGSSRIYWLVAFMYSSYYSIVYLLGFLSTWITGYLPLLVYFALFGAFTLSIFWIAKKAA